MSESNRTDQATPVAEHVGTLQRLYDATAGAPDGWTPSEERAAIEAGNAVNRELEKPIAREARQLQPLDATVQSDLRSAGLAVALERLVCADERYDPGRGTPLWGYVRPWVVEAMQKELRRRLGYSEEGRKRYGVIRRAQAQLTAERSGRVPSYDEIAERASALAGAPVYTGTVRRLLDALDGNVAQASEDVRDETPFDVDGSVRGEHQHYADLMVGVLGDARAAKFVALSLLLRASDVGYEWSELVEIVRAPPGDLEAPTWRAVYPASGSPLCALVSSEWATIHALLATPPPKNVTSGNLRQFYSRCGKDVAAARARIVEAEEQRVMGGSARA